MRAVVQRVRSAAVSIGEGASEREVGRIGRGLVAFVGVERADQTADVDYIAGKIREIRVFEDPQDPSRHLNRSVQEVGGEVLVVSQFTILGDCRKGRRPSFDAAARRLWPNHCTRLSLGRSGTRASQWRPACSRRRCRSRWSTTAR